MTPEEWFDQFPELEDNSAWPTESNWCPRHWAPCPILEANGVGATIELMQAYIEQTKIPSNQVALLNMQMQLDNPICCKLGDEKMYEIWGHWPPAKGTE